MKPVTKERHAGDSAYEKGDYAAAKATYLSLVERNSTSDDPDTQDEVAVARIRLGYVAAKSDDFEGAREIFLQVEREYRGNGYGSQFGSLPEQAAYQAAVCLIAQGDEEGAEREFVAFIKSQQTSPLVHAAFGRLVKLNGGNAKPEHEKLLQAAVTSRDKHIRKQMALCGPRAIEHVLKTFSVKSPGIDEISRACRTSDSGTTMADMIRALKSFGLAATGYRLAFNDLASLPLPAVWLDQKHYLVILQAEGRMLTIYDPVDNSIKQRELPEKGLHTQTLDLIKITRVNQ